MSPAFVAAMEDVLDVYAEPYDPRRPVVGFDERPLQLVAETRTPLPVQPGRPRRFDYEYRRNGTCNLFTTVEPLAGWRHVEVTERRTAIDVAHQLKWLVDEVYPNARVVRVVLDNLNVHVIASLYVAFPAPEARRIARKLEFHYTPKHGSWLNVAECELAVLASQCRSAPAHHRRRSPGDRRLGESAQLRAADCRLALHHRPGSPQAQAPVPTPGMTAVVSH